MEAALDQLLALPRGERGARLKTLARGDAALEAELHGLLAAESALGDFMEGRPPPTGIESSTPPSLAANARVGPYRVLQLLGRGGMGEVYLAERADDQFEQRVALKLSAAPLAEGTASFAAERQILAQLEHPGIARLLDGGLAADGRPYMAMEYVEGLDLCRWCERQAPTLELRLALFRQVLAAVAYAHRHLVIHRDLKPGNILVTAEGQTKLLDFGIAKLLDPARAGGEPGRTRHLTPTYAAPEQLQGGATSTATDVHALGVILYELLVGEPPWPLAELPLALSIARVLDAEPPRPSQAAQRILDRGGSPPALPRQLAGDLDGILMKALRKLPEQRYASAAELLADLERHQRHEPVNARGYDLHYVVGRFVRRHRMAVASAGAVLLALVAGLAVSLGFYFEARRARDHAESSAATAEAVNDFLNRDLLASADIAQGPTRDIGLRELLDAAARQIGERFSGQPEAAARIHESLGDSYVRLTAYEPAQVQFARALALRSALGGRGSPAALSVLTKHANALAHVGRYEQASVLFEEAVAGHQRRGDAHAVSRLRMEQSGLLYGLGDLAGATRLARQLLETEARTPTLSEAERLDLAGRYGAHLRWLGDYVAAERELRAAATGRVRLLGEEQIDTADSRLMLGSLLVETHRLDAAAAEIEPALAVVRRWVGPDDAMLAMALNTAARLRLAQNRAGEAEPLMADALRIRRLVFGADSSFTAWTETQYAEVLQRQGRLAEALALTEVALPRAERLDGPLSLWTTQQRLTQAAILRELGRHQRLAQRLDSIPSEAFARLPAQHPLLGLLRQEQGLLATQRGDLAQARAALSEALAIFELRYGKDHPRSRAARGQLAALAATGR